MQCKHPQPVADALVSANKSPKIPANQKVTIDRYKIPSTEPINNPKNRNNYHETGTR